MSNRNKTEKLQELTDHIDVLVGPRRSLQAKRLGVQPMSTQTMQSTVQSIKRMFNREPTKVLEPRGIKMKSTHDEATTAHVFRMPVDEVATLAQLAQNSPSMVVEVDSHLRYGNLCATPLMEELLRRNPLGEGLQQVEVRIRVVGEGDKPVEGANVTVEGAAFPQNVVTDENGDVAVPLFSIPGAPLVNSVFVRPKEGHWNRMLNSPAMSTDAINVVRLKPIAETFVGFPKNAPLGWGQEYMGLDRLPDEFTGKGVKIAIIDSGADTKHPALKHIKEGFDMTNGANTASWKEDVIGHGSHCAGVITGNPPGTESIRGFAPEAEIIVLKVFPGGQFSSLVEALDKCIELGVDVVNMSLGAGEPSEIVEQQIEECVANGVACIVAAGNSGGPVQYPAQSSSVLAVAALGQIGQVPGDSWEATQRSPSNALPDGVFSPTFTCHGPEIDVAAPGVGIVSTVPGGFDPQSGTSMAAPHVCGMAALMLAHHAGLNGMAKDLNRVAQLFGLIRTACHSLPLDSERMGSGVPLLGNVVAQFISESQEAEVGLASAGPVFHGARNGAQPMGGGQMMTFSAGPNAYSGQPVWYPRPGGLLYTPQGVFYR